MKKGFTLIELLVVVLIIGILSAIALPQYKQAVLNARLVEAKIISTSLYQALERYRLANGSYPDDGSHRLDDLTQNLDISIPSVKSYFSVFYYTSAYVGVFYNPLNICISWDWRQTEPGKAIFYCGMTNAGHTQEQVDACKRVCGHSNFETFDDGYGCRLN